MCRIDSLRRNLPATEAIAFDTGWQPCASQIGGVILVALASKAIEVATGQIQQISARLGTKRAKEYLKSDDFRGLDLAGIPEARP